MYNPKHSEWNNMSNLDWNTDRNDSLMTGNVATRTDYGTTQQLMTCHNASCEYPCLEKNVYSNENYAAKYGYGNYPTMYQSCSDEEWLSNYGNFTSQYAEPLTTCYRQQFPQQQHAYWSKHYSIPVPAAATMGSGGYQTTMNCTPSGTAVSVAATTTAPASSDPLNALQNLTVSAGQSAAHMMAQQQNTRLSSTAYNSQNRQRPLVQGSSNRPLDVFAVAQSPMPQHLIQSQLSANVSISNPSSMNAANNTRLSTNVIALKPEMCINQNTLMLPPYPMETSTLMNSVHTVPKPMAGKMVQYSGTMPSQYPSLKDQFTPSTQSPLIVPASKSNFQPESTLKPSLPPATSSRPQSIVNEEESKKVKSEMKKLKERYFKMLTIILENPKNCLDDELKVWTALKNLLENPDSIAKPLSMKHIVKIEQILLKADQRLVSVNSSQISNVNTGKPCQKPLQPSSQTHGLGGIKSANEKPTINYDETLMKKSVYGLNVPHDNIDSHNRSINFSSLDIAFDDVCHQLTKTDNTLIKRVQQSLVEFVKMRPNKYRHFMPKRVFVDMEENNATADNEAKRAKMNSPAPEAEFCDLEDVTSENKDFLGVKDPMISVLDENRLLRSDLNIAHVDMNLCNLQEELAVLKHEFQIKKLEDQEQSKSWFSYDSDWSGSQYYSFQYDFKDLPSTVPLIRVRISEDYENSGYTDWNLNLDLNQSHFDEFLDDVINILTFNFTDAHQNYQWSGIPLVYVMSLYKRSILSAFSNHINRNGSHQRDTQ